MSYLIPASLGFVVYNAFRLEITEYWRDLFLKSMVEIPGPDGVYSDRIYNYDLMDLSSIWVINYSILFLIVLSFINIKWIKNKFFGIVNLGLNAFGLLVFLTMGFVVLSQLVNHYLYPNNSDYYVGSSFYFSVRYISYALIVLLLISKFIYLKQAFMQTIPRLLFVIFDSVLLITIIWILSQELITWSNISHVNQSDKLGLSILWGVYSLVVIVLGIWKKKKHFRIGSMAFFGIILIKLFFYDLVHLNTISKTIVFVSLGVLLLIISFLYNKYKHLITDEK